MSTPVVYTSTRRVGFSELDPFNHLSTGRYASYFVDHRMQGLREHLGWDAAGLAGLGFMTWVRRIEIDFVRPARAGHEVTIMSSVREFRGTDAIIDCRMLDEAGRTVSYCVMTVAHVDATTLRATDWPAERASLFFEDARVPVAAESR